MRVVVTLALCVIVAGCTGGPVHMGAQTPSPTPTTANNGLDCTPWPSEWMTLVTVNESVVVGDAIAYENLSTGYRKATREMLANERMYRRQIPEFPDYIVKNGTYYELSDGMVEDHCTKHPPPTPYPTDGT